MIKNIVFDMGNVLLDYNPDVSINMYIDKQSDKELIKKELFCSEEWVLKDKGLISEKEMFLRISKRVPEHLQEGLNQCIKNWSICMDPIKGAEECLKKCKSEGYRIYIISNAGKDFYEYFPRFMPLSFFNGIVVSSDLHIVKPDIEIYNYFLKKYELNSEECLFIDDRIDNIKGAIKAGMKAVKFNGDYCVIEEAINKEKSN